jgi:hypothetical protein
MATHIQTVDVGRGYSVPMYETFNHRRYRYSLLNPTLGALTKGEAQGRAEAARKAGWSIRVVKVNVPVYSRGGAARRVLRKEGYLLYERKSRRTAPAVVGKPAISSDIGRKPWHL